MSKHALCAQFPDITVNLTAEETTQRAAAKRDKQKADDAKRAADKRAELKRKRDDKLAKQKRRRELEGERKRKYA